jgi:hypothetical protein
VEQGDYACAVRAQGRAVELGCDDPDLGREMLAWYLLKAGKKAQGEAAFLELRAERGEDPGILSTLANARMDSGDGAGAIEAFDAALAAAKRAADHDWLREMRAERRYAGRELGLEPDEDDRLAAMAEPDGREASAHWSLAWFPRDQIAAALARWPSLTEDLADPDAYCRSIEGKLRATSILTGRRPALAPLHVDRLSHYAEEHGLDPDSGSARSGLAAELGRTRAAIAWPPGRNEPCWCGSQRKYKRCCAQAVPQELEPPAARTD